MINKDKLLRLANQMLKEAEEIYKIRADESTTAEFNHRRGIIIGINKVVKLIERQ